MMESHLQDSYTTHHLSHLVSFTVSTYFTVGKKMWSTLFSLFIEVVCVSDFGSVANSITSSFITFIVTHQKKKKKWMISDMTVSWLSRNKKDFLSRDLTQLLCKDLICTCAVEKKILMIPWPVYWLYSG